MSCLDRWPSNIQRWKSQTWFQKPTITTFPNFDVSRTTQLDMNSFHDIRVNETNQLAFFWAMDYLRQRNKETDWVEVHLCSYNSSLQPFTLDFWSLQLATWVITLLLKGALMHFLLDGTCAVLRYSVVACRTISKQFPETTDVSFLQWFYQ